MSHIISFSDESKDTVTFSEFNDKKLLKIRSESNRLNIGIYVCITPKFAKQLITFLTEQLESIGYDTEN